MPNVNLLLEWYEMNKRDLPWRQTRDPYKIWLSEIILQQTRVGQGLNYYQEFLRQFPTIQQLAAAEEDAVLKVWQGLGYYSRARNLHHAAKTVVSEYDGEFPGTYEDIIKLKGVGSYTAAAVASIVFNEPRPVVDGNVMRVVSRWFAITEPVDSVKGRRNIEIALDRLIDKAQPGQFNQAMMEFGATFCKPKKPDCANCIFRENCQALRLGLVEELPRKKPKREVKNRYFNYFFFRIIRNNQGFTILKKRSGNDIWKGLYEFPLIEATAEEMPDELAAYPLIRQIADSGKLLIRKVSKPYIHQLTHQRINAKFLEVEIQHKPPHLPDGYREVQLSKIHDYPVSRLVNRYLEDSNL